MDDIRWFRLVHVEGKEKKTDSLYMRFRVMASSKEEACQNIINHLDAENKIAQEGNGSPAPILFQKIVTSDLWRARAHDREIQESDIEYRLTFMGGARGQGLEYVVVEDKT